MFKQKTDAHVIVSYFAKLIETICVLLFALLVSSSFLQVVFRFVLRRPLLWSEELTRYTGVWLVMLSTSLAVLRRSHMSIDIFTSKLPQKIQMLLTVFSDFIVFFVACFMVFAMFMMISKFHATPSPAMRIPMGVIYTGVMSGWICTSVIALYMLINTLTELKKNAGGNKTL
jgi:TRAP-type C4-dicarboxylate transport system permease small subunit